MLKTYLFIVFCQKMKIGKKYFLSHFGHYLISAFCDIQLISVCDATYGHQRNQILQDCTGLET